jgi:hypothetical protein
MSRPPTHLPTYEGCSPPHTNLLLTNPRVVKISLAITALSRPAYCGKSTPGQCPRRGSCTLGLCKWGPSRMGRRSCLCGDMVVSMATLPHYILFLVLNRGGAERCVAGWTEGIPRVVGAGRGRRGAGTDVEERVGEWKGGERKERREEGGRKPGQEENLRPLQYLESGSARLLHPASRQSSLWSRIVILRAFSARYWPRFAGCMSVAAAR